MRSKAWLLAHALVTKISMDPKLRYPPVCNVPEGERVRVKTFQTSVLPEVATVDAGAGPAGMPAL